MIVTDMPDRTQGKSLCGDENVGKKDTRGGGSRVRGGSKRCIVVAFEQAEGIRKLLQRPSQLRSLAVVEFSHYVDGGRLAGRCDAVNECSWVGSVESWAFGNR